MNSGILQDIWLGFVGQLRRSPWGALLLWTGLTLATVALAVGFGLAQSVYTGLLGRLPAMDRLYYLEASETVTPDADGTMPLPTWKGFSTATLDRLIQEGMLAGFFYEVKGRPVRILGQEEGGGSGQAREIKADFIVFSGRVPLYGGKATEALARIQLGGGVAANQGLAARADGPRVGELLLMRPGDIRPLMALVGPEAGLDRRSVLLAAVEPAGGDRSAPGRELLGSTHPAVVGVYLAPGVDPTALQTRLSTWLQEAHPHLQVSLTSGEGWHGQALREARTVAAMASGIALLLTLVAFINTGSFASLWIWNRTGGLALRRTLGATPRLITIYVIADLVLIAGTALLAGLGLVLLADRLWFQPLQIPALTAASMAVACLIMIAGTAIMGMMLTGMVSRAEPGTVLGRAL